MLRNEGIEPEIKVDLKKRSLQTILLNGESLARHFKFINPDLKKRIAFGVSDLFNTLKNKDRKSTHQDEIVLKEEYPLYDENSDTDETTDTSDEEEKRNSLEKDESQEKHEWHKWDVIDQGLILGVIPEPDMIDEIKSLAQFSLPPSLQTPTLHIYCITDDFEPGMGKKVQPIQHKELGNVHYLMPMTDFGGGATTREAVLAAVYHMRQTILNGDAIYIHCKAGRARSAMVVATYLAIYPPKDAQYKQYDLNGAIKYLKNKRKQVNLHQNKVADDQWQFLHDPELHNIKGIGKLEKASQAIALHKNLIERQEELCKVKSNDSNENFLKILNLAEDLPIEAFNEASISNYPFMKHGDTILSSLEFKNHLLQMSSFKQLKLIATQAQAQGKRVDYMYELCTMILTATDDSWFSNRCTDAKHPITQLFYNIKSEGELSQLVNDFLKEVGQYKKDQMDALNIKQSAEQIQLKKLGDYMRDIQGYVKNLHKISKKATVYEKIGVKRNLDKCWDTLCEKYQSFKAKPSSVKKIKELLVALDEINLRLANRIKDEKKFIQKHDDFQSNLNNYSTTICEFKIELSKYHESVIESEKKKLQSSNRLFANRNKNSDFSSSNTVDLKNSQNQFN